MALRSQTQRSLLFAFIASIVLCGLVGIYHAADDGRGALRLLQMRVEVLH